jgi:LMBR1-like membrane protein
MVKIGSSNSYQVSVDTFYSELIWYRYFFLASKYAEFLIFTVCSVCIFIWEQNMFMASSTQRSTLIDLFNSSQKDTKLDPINVLIIMSLLMSYMIYVSFIGIFSAKVLDYYEFFPGNTSSSTLLNSSFYILKLTPAICFNLLNIILGDTPLVDKTAFSKVAKIEFNLRA